jgi:glycosyltransferase involved in cell wall biosynthesis
VTDRLARELSVVVPVRNAEHLVDDCLRSILDADPREVIVVDGLSSDRTLEICRRHPVRIMSDEGRGLPAARRIGAEAARGPLVALVDADVVVPEGGLERLLDEYDRGRYTALQAGLHSVSGRGYWGRALAFHHQTGRSRHWFGLVATVFERDALLRHGFDDRFLSGEDIDLRWRLRSAGCRIGVSRTTLFEHRFDDDFEFAKGQWLADGAGLGRMVATRGARALPLLALPLAAAGRGLAVSVLRLQLQWIPYFALFAAYNYIGLTGVLWRAVTGARSAGFPA